MTFYDNKSVTYTCTIKAEEGDECRVDTDCIDGRGVYVLINDLNKSDSRELPFSRRRPKINSGRLDLYDSL